MLAGVMLAVIGVPMLAVTLVPVLARALGRSLGGERADPDLVAELDELRARVQQLEERESRMAELEERLEFAERLLPRADSDARLHG